MKKNQIFPLLLAALLLLGLIAPAGAANANAAPKSAFEAAVSLQPPELLCAAAILVDGDNDEVLFDYNAYQRMYPASITKIMTSLLVMEAISRGELDLDQEITASATAIAAITPDSSTQNIRPGEIMPLREVLYCDLVSSANEACNILAETVAGTMENFVVRMNQRAAELGMKDTHFVNPNGLHDPQHYSTAYDIYLMAKEAMKHELFRTIVATAQHQVPATNMSDARNLNNTNLLINNRQIAAYSYAKAIGIKTGSTLEAGYCLASAAVDTNGRTFYCVVLDAEFVRDEDGNLFRHTFLDSRELLEWGFDNFQRTVLLDETADLWEVPVTLSDEQDHLVVQPKGTIERTMPTDYDPEKAELIPTLPESLEAPVEEGQKVGTVTLRYNGEDYGTLDLVTVSGAARSETQYRIKTAKEFLDRWWVKAAIAAGVVLLFFLFVLTAVIIPRNRRRKSRGYRYSGGRRRRY